MNHLPTQNIPNVTFLGTFRSENLSVTFLELLLDFLEIALHLWQDHHARTLPEPTLELTLELPQSPTLAKTP